MSGFIHLNDSNDGNSTFFDVSLESWLSGWPLRRRILERSIEAINAPIREEPFPGSERAAAPAIALLRAGCNGLAVLESGEFDHTVVARIAGVFPDWAGDEPERNLARLYRILARGHLIERNGDRVVTCQSALPLIEKDHDVVIAMGTMWTVAGEGFNTDAAELAAALLVNGEPCDPITLATKTHPALAEYWTAEGEIVSLDHAYRSIRSWLATLSALGGIPDRWIPELRHDRDRWPGPVGPFARDLLAAMLGYRTSRHVPRRFPH